MRPNPCPTGVKMAPEPSPGPFSLVAGTLVAGTGFEPATSGLWANQWQLHVDPLVSNVHVTVDQPSLPSQPVPYDLWPCAAFRSQIRSQQSAQQLRPPRGETSNHHDAQHSQLDDWGVHRKACPSLELVVQQSILYCDTTRG